MRRHRDEARRVGAAAMFTAILFMMLVAPSARGQGKKVVKPPRLDDSEITEAVETALYHDPQVSAHLIDVETEDGVVGLSGTVDNLLSADRAVSLARAIKGGIAVIDRLDVQPVERPDAEIMGDVRVALLRDSATESYEVNVEVDDAEVTLGGKVDSWQERELAEQVAKGVRGVRSVKNNIIVDFKGDRADAQIRTDVVRRLEADVHVLEPMIDVKVEQGKVILSGAVASAAEKMLARSDAWVAGVDSVDASGLEVRWWAYNMRRDRMRGIDLESETVEKWVRTALAYDPRVGIDKIDINTRGGVVTLTGVVKDLSAKRAAGRTAESVFGVWRVRNRLRVRPPRDMEDPKIADRVREALVRDPYVQPYPIDVRVRNGLVYLSGNVDSDFQKNRAEAVASRVQGVVDVRNALIVPEDWRVKTDEELAEDVRSRLYWSAAVDSDNITVEVRGGTVTLLGTVNSWFERRVAGEKALSAGAVRVRNNLRVRRYVPPFYLPRERETQ